MPGEDGLWLIQQLRRLKSEQGGRIRRSPSPRTGTAIQPSEWRSLVSRPFWWSLLTPSICSERAHPSSGA